MKGFSRALELNCLFLLVVALLLALQLILQRSQNGILLQLSERGDDGEAGEDPQLSLPHPDSLNIPALDTHPAGHAKALSGDGGGGGGGDRVLAAPVVPNIHRSFPKRKAPYIRKAKNKKKKKNRKVKQQQQQKSAMRGGGGGMEGGMGRGPVVAVGGNRGGIEKSSRKVINKRGKTKEGDKTKTKI